MQWSDEAREIIDDLLHELPLPVRDGVRQAAEVRAESLAEETPSSKVSLEIAVRAFIESTPADLRQRLKHTLSYKGIDPEEFEAAFAS
ncbi:MAG TPA: DUF2621 family protein [Terriglobales bacterium]|jgi:hypothetical protein|nr:DUF2621 family protein [Terriglobales bacterium]